MQAISAGGSFSRQNDLLDGKQTRGGVTKTLASVYRRVLIDQALAEAR